MESISAAGKVYSQIEGKVDNVVCPGDGSLTKMASQRMFSDPPEVNRGFSTKRSFLQESPQQPLKRQKIEKQIEETINQKNNHNGTISINLSEVASSHTERVGIIVVNDIVAKMDDRKRVDKIKAEYVRPFSSLGYYPAVFKKEVGGKLEEAVAMDRSEAETFLGGFIGITWWIREGFFNGRKVDKGIVYVHGTCFLYLLSTDKDFLTFFDKNIVLIPYFETLRREKLDKIKNECILRPSSTGYYQSVFAEKSIKSPVISAENTQSSTNKRKTRAQEKPPTSITVKSRDDLIEIDSSEAQSILGGVQGQVWWIREDFNDKERYEGVVYLDGRCFHYNLCTDKELIGFFNQNFATTHLEILRREKINKVKNEYMLQPSCDEYYQRVFKAESEGLLDEALQMAMVEAKSVLGDTKTKTWWIQKGFFNGQEGYKGIAYWGEGCASYLLCTDTDWLDFYNENALIPDLEALREEKIDTMKNMCVSLSSSEYHQAVFKAESEGLLDEVFQLAILEAQIVLGNTKTETWWIQKGFFNGQEVYKGIIYSNGECTHYVLSTSNDWIDFYNKNNSITYLEVLRKEKIDKIKNSYMLLPSFGEYHQAVFKAESEGLLDEALKMAISEVKFVLGDVKRATWWIQKTLSNGQEVYKGVVYSDEGCTFYLLPTDNYLIAFLNQNSSIRSLETLRRRKIYSIKNEYVGSLLSEGYYQTVFEAESKGLLNEAVKMDLVEGKTILSAGIGKAWWIRKGFLGDQECYKGIVYSDGKCSFHTLDAGNDLIDFFNKNQPNQYLEAIRKRQINRQKKQKKATPIENQSVHTLSRIPPRVVFI